MQRIYKKKNINKESGLICGASAIASGGYAILYTVVIISIIMTIATGLSNSVNKELILSTVAKDSQAAFYQADMATECALLLVKTTGGVASLFPSPGVFSCGVDKNGVQVTLSILPNSGGGYAVMPLAILGDNQPCFSMDVKENVAVGASELNVSGYSSCNPNNKRRVERSLQIKY